MSSESDAPMSASPWHPVTENSAVPESESGPVEPPTVTPSRHPELEERFHTLSDTHGLTPAKPPLPGADDRDASIPTPIEADPAELVPAVTLPDAAETFPAGATPQEHARESMGGGDEADAATGGVPVSPYLAPFTPPAGVVRADATPTMSRKLPPSAVALLSAGDLSDLDDVSPAFVPRFEPAAGEVDEATGVKVADHVQEESPLAHTTLSDSEDAAYEPAVAAPPSGPIPTVAATDHPLDTEAVSPSAPIPPEDAMPTESASEPTGGADDTPADALRPSDGRAEEETAASSSQEPRTPESDLTAAEGGGAPAEPPIEDGDGGDDNDGATGSLWTSTAFLVVVGVIVIAGLGIAAYLLFFQPDSKPLPVQTVVAAAPTPTLEPINPSDASEFSASLPSYVGVYVLTDNIAMLAASPESIPEGIELPDGVAEHHTLTYSDGPNDIVVDAWQHYDIAAAQATFEGLNIDGTDPQPVLVDGQDVGTQVDVMSEAGPTVLWSNATAVFSVNGPADQIHAFVDQFGH